MALAVVKGSDQDLACGGGKCVWKESSSYYKLQHGLQQEGNPSQLLPVVSSPTTTNNNAAAATNDNDAAVVVD